MLKAKGFRSDPVKAWKASLASNAVEDQPDQSEEPAQEEEEEEEGEDYNYLMSMSMWSLSVEKKEELLKDRDAKVCGYSPTYHKLVFCQENNVSGSLFSLFTTLRTFLVSFPCYYNRTFLVHYPAIHQYNKQLDFR